jgi:CheY-like chemotaxis protein
MNKSLERFVILMADDDDDDCLLVRSAFEEAGRAEGVRFVPDGLELMNYLHRIGEYADPDHSPRPDLILLDLNMPRKDGREALKEIKAGSNLRSIPIVVLTTSKEERDIEFCREAGASSFVTKPVMFKEWVAVVDALMAYLQKNGTLPSSLG